MTKQERKIKSMLNYFQIDMEGSRDEKMTKKQKDDFIDRLNANYDAHTVRDVFQKIQDKFKDKKDEGEEDPFFDSLNEDEKEDSFLNHFPKDLNSPSGPKSGGFGNLPFGLNPEIEKFIGWLSDLLYSADHKVIIKESEDGMTTNIELQKIKKKRGGRKK